MPRVVLCVACVLMLGGGASAEIATVAKPIYHGILRVNPASGTIDRQTGSATIKVNHWALILDSEESDGIYPNLEPIIVAIGIEPPFSLDAGALRASHNGKTFSYRGKLKRGDRGISKMTIHQEADGSYAVRFMLMGVDLSSLIFNDPLCLPMAVIIGNDDGFSGVNVTTAPKYGTRVRIPSECDQVPVWPWT